MREENRPKIPKTVYEKKKKFGPETYEWSEEWRTLRNEKLCELSSQFSLDRHVIRVREKKGVQN
jgi:hypothetical protein